MRIVLVTSVHPVFDKRVFQRHALLLRSAGHEVHLVAPNDEARTVSEGVEVHGFPRPTSYLARVGQLGTLLRLALSLRGDLYHLHDPDLLAIGWKIRRALGVPVVYDAHEDFSVERRVLGMPMRASRFLSGSIGKVEQSLARRLDGVVCPHGIRLAELQHPRKAALFLPNYPPRGIFDPPPASTVRERSLVYSGLLSISRGADLILDAAERMSDVKFVLLAKFMVASEEAYFSRELSRRQLPNVENRGFVPFAEVPLHLWRAGVGIMPWRRTPQHVRAAQPSKIYEYMACALPILASDLPVTREVILGNECGRLHAADDTDDFVANAYALLDDPASAVSAGSSGRLAFEQRYSFEAAGQQLLLMYESLVSKRACGPSSVDLAGSR